MSDNSDEKVFKAISKILDDHTEITWNWPTISSFVVERRKIDGGDGSWEAIGQIPADRRTYSMGNSSENSKYEYRVVANTDNNEIIFASQVTGIAPLAEKTEAKSSKERPVKSGEAPELVPPIAPTPPVRPQGPPDFDWTSPGVCKVSWNPPSNDGGSPITSYIIEKKSGNGWSQVNEVPSDSTTALLTFTAHVRRQRLAITAVNACGRSTPLITEKFSSPPARQVEIDSSNQDYIELKWPFPDRPESKNAEVKFFNIQRRIVERGDEKFVTIRHHVMGDSYRDRYVVPGQKYQYLVLANGLAGVVARMGTKYITFHPTSTQAKVQKEASIQEDSIQSIDQMDEAGPSGVKQEVREQEETAPVKRKVGDSEVAPSMKRMKM